MKKKLFAQQYRYWGEGGMIEGEKKNLFYCFVLEHFPSHQSVSIAGTVMQVYTVHTVQIINYYLFLDFKIPL